MAKYRVIDSDVASWAQPETGSSLLLKDEDLVVAPGVQKDMCKFYGIPGCLPDVDAKHHTHVVKDVMMATTNEKVQFLVEEGKRDVVSVIDPKSTFITDDEYGKMLEHFGQAGMNMEEFKSGPGGISNHVMMENQDANILGDIIKKRMILERLPQGGVYLSAGLMRMICTNGATVKEKELSAIRRNGIFDKESLDGFIKAIGAFDLDAYLKSKWFVDGKPVEASVADYYGMRSTLAKFTDPEVASSFFPTEPITDFYKSQGIELSSLNNNLRNKIPSGLSYYDVFNILTNGIKQVKNHSVETDIEVAKWGFGSRILGIRQIEQGLKFTGKPTFLADEVRRLKGDKIAA